MGDISHDFLGGRYTLTSIIGQVGLKNDKFPQICDIIWGPSSVPVRTQRNDSDLILQMIR